MDKPERLLQQIESQWPIHIARGIAELVRAHPEQRVYAAAFWQFYCDYTVIHPPAFGANTKGSLEDEVEEESTARWAPRNGDGTS